MNGKTLLMTCAALLTGFTVFAADQLAAEKVDMQKTSAAPEVQEQFNEPDGAALFPGEKKCRTPVWDVRPFMRKRG